MKKTWNTLRQRETNWRRNVQYSTFHECKLSGHCDTKRGIKMCKVSSFLSREEHVYIT